MSGGILQPGGSKVGPDNEQKSELDQGDTEAYTRSGESPNGLTEDEKSYLDKLAWITVRNLLLEAGLLNDESYLPGSFNHSKRKKARRKNR
jgi:hypothetical protein